MMPRNWLLATPMQGIVTAYPSDEKRATGLPGSVTECLEIGSVRSSQTHSSYYRCLFQKSPIHAASVPEMQWIAVNKLNEMTGKKAITSGMLSNVQGDSFHICLTSWKKTLRISSF